MVKNVQQKELSQFQCEACGFVYPDKKWAEKCESWCEEHHSCNLEIIQHGTPPSS